MYEYEKINVTQTLELTKKTKVSRVEDFVFMSIVKRILKKNFKQIY